VVVQQPVQRQPLTVAALWQLTFGILELNYAVEGTQIWLDDDQDAKGDDYEQKRKDVQQVYSPILGAAGEALDSSDDNHTEL